MLLPYAFKAQTRTVCSTAVLSAPTISLDSAHKANTLKKTPLLKQAGGGVTENKLQKGFFKLLLPSSKEKLAIPMPVAQGVTATLKSQ